MDKVERCGRVRFSTGWTKEEDAALRAAVRRHSGRNWAAIARDVPGRNHGQCQQRWANALKPGLKKGPWSREEDTQLVSLVRDSHLRAEQTLSLAELAGLKTQTTAGTGVNADDCDWTFISSQIPGRTNKQCKERWRSCLDPALVRRPFTP